jgi:hypothetical protein
MQTKHEDIKQWDIVESALNTISKSMWQSRSRMQSRDKGNIGRRAQSEDKNKKMSDTLKFYSDLSSFFVV